MQDPSYFDPASVSREQKYAALESVIEMRNLLEFPEGTPPSEQARLKAWFISELTNELGEKTDRRANKISSWLLGGMPVMLHPGAPAPSPLRTELRDTQPTRLHLYEKDETPIQLFGVLVQQAGIVEYSRAKGVTGTETDGSLPHQEKIRKPLRSDGIRTLYDPQAESLDTRSGPRKHDIYDLTVYGKMRIAPRSLDMDTSAFETTRNIDQNTYENILSKPGQRWLWEHLHSYLLSEDALSSKTPARWFRDMCVLCGVSTVKLQDLTGIHQTTWSAIQNEQQIFTSHAPITARHIHTALSHYLEKNTAAGPSMKHHLPAGSLFGLPVTTFTGPDNIAQTVTDPQALARIETFLFKGRTTGAQEIKVHHELKQLQRIAQAYRAGALSEEEILEHNVPRAVLHKIVGQYGITKLYNFQSPEYGSVANFIRGRSNNCADLCNLLAYHNKQQWHIPEPEFNDLMQAITWLPSTPGQLCSNGQRHKAEDSWEFARNHHNGTLPDLLIKMHYATDISQASVAAEIGLTRESISQYARGENSERSTTARALSKTLKGEWRYKLNGELENMWLFPLDARRHIRPDVVEHINNFKQHPRPASPQSHWKSLADAVDHLADSAKTLHLDMAEYRDYPMLGKFTSAVKAQNTHPLLAEVQASLDKRLENAPAISPFLLFVLPNGSEILTKRNANGECLVLDTDQPKLQEWLLTVINSQSAPHSGASRASNIGK